MGFHHVAVATRNVEAAHAFYTGPMGFRLVKVEVAATEAGFAKHLFYDTGGSGMFALWDFHDTSLPKEWNPAISSGLGLPVWANHIAFAADGLSDLEARRKRILDHGVDVMEIDHDWCRSIYARDPNGILVEFCTSVRDLTEADAADAERLLRDPKPALHEPKAPVFHRAEKR